MSRPFATPTRTLGRTLRLGSGLKDGNGPDQEDSDRDHARSRGETLPTGLTDEDQRDTQSSGKEETQTDTPHNEG